jgi:hypothetical protein
MGQSASMNGVRSYHSVIVVWRAKEAESACMKYWQISLAILAALSTSIALPDDFKTVDGKEYKNVKVSRVEPDGIVITFSGGIVKLPFIELPEDVRKKYGYDLQAAATYTAEGNQKQAELAAQRKGDEQRRFEEREKYWSDRAQIKSQQQAEIQRQREKASQEAAKQQPQAETQRGLASTPSLSKEGIPEHTYELLQDYTVDMGAWSKRLRRGERYHGRILVNRAEIDINGISFRVPSGILSAPKD